MKSPTDFRYVCNVTHQLENQSNPWPWSFGWSRSRLNRDCMMSKRSIIIWEKAVAKTCWINNVLENGWWIQTLGLYATTILKNVLSVVLPIFLYFEALEYYTTSDWVNDTVQPIRSCVTFRVTKSWRRRQRMFLRLVGGEYGSWSHRIAQAYRWVIATLS